MKLRNVPLRLATGAYILHTGWEKWHGDEARAAGVHGMASNAFPVFNAMKATDFLKTLSVGEMALGAALLTPFVPPALAGAALTGFSGALVTMYLRTDGMHRPGQRLADGPGHRAVEGRLDARHRPGPDGGRAPEPARRLTRLPRTTLRYADDTPGTPTRPGLHETGRAGMVDGSCQQSTKESTLLTLTENASTIVKDIAAQQGGAESTGLRISSEDPAAGSDGDRGPAAASRRPHRRVARRRGLPRSSGLPAARRPDPRRLGGRVRSGAVRPRTQA